MTQPSSIPRLRILHIVSGDRWAGAEVQAFTLIKELSRSHDISTILLNQGELACRLQNIDVPVTIFDEKLNNSWQIFKQIRRTLQRIRPQIIHTHRQKENVLGSIANKLSINAKCVRTVHGDFESESDSGGLARIQAAVNGFCGRHLMQAIIAVSDELHYKLESRLPADRIFTVLNGIDPQTARADLCSPDFRISLPDNVHVGIVGRIDPVKRIDIFLNMARLLLQQHPETPWHFHVFGEGDLEVDMNALSETLGISDQVTFHGHRMDIKDCIFGLNALVMCSDHEGLPMTALESIAIGTPMIAHSTGGLTNLFEQRPARLVHNHDAESYARAVYQAVVDNNNQPMKYPDEYCVEHTAADMTKLYCRILGQ